MRTDLMILGLALMVSAAPRILPAAESGACETDIQKFCKDISAGGGRILKCLKEHDAELSDSCKAQRQQGRAALKETAQEASAACKEDVQKFCKGVQPGEGRILQCLQQHDAELSTSCKEFRTQARTEIKDKAMEVSAACKNDVAKHCKGTQPGEGRLMQCLRDHESDVSDGCKATL